MTEQTLLYKIAHKIEMLPAEEQVLYFQKACGVARFSYNWGLAEWKKQYQEGERPNWMALKKKLNSLKEVQFPWMYEVTKCAPEGALADLGAAWANYFRDLNKKTSRKTKQPRFKKKGKSRDSFYISNDQFSVQDQFVDLPHIGKVSLVESLRFSGKVLGATIGRNADRWFISIQVETPLPHRKCKNPLQSVAGDLGLETDLTLSTGRKFRGPKSLRKHLKKLARENRSLHRKTLGSKRRKKAAKKVAKVHQKIVNVRLDFIHKTTTQVANQFGIVCLEDLNTAGMLKNHKLARSLSDISFHEFKRQIKYKTAQRGGKVLYAERFFPSSKECRKCRTKNENLSLKDRIFSCVNSECAHREDRDVHASRNILIHCTRGRRGNHARGQRASMPCASRKRFASRKLSGLKRETCINVKKEIKVGNYV